MIVQYGLIYMFIHNIYYIANIYIYIYIYRSIDTHQMFELVYSVVVFGDMVSTSGRLTLAAICFVIYPLLPSFQSTIY